MALRIGINAQMIPGRGVGGVEQVVIGLVYALGRLTDGGEEYVILTSPAAPDWVRPYTGPNMRIVTRPSTMAPSKFVELLKRMVPEPVKQARRWVRKQMHYKKLCRIMRDDGQIKSNDGFLESLCLNVIHFPFQEMELCDVLSLFNPHDLQHLHLPGFFTREQICWRQRWYRMYCQYAEAVVVASEWVRQDIIKHYNIVKEKIYVVPFGAPTQAYKALSSEELGKVKSKFKLPDVFALYPAQSFAHKNHLRLIEAIAASRAKYNVSVHLICTGARKSFSREIAELGLEKQVHFLGFVQPEELRALYKLAQFVILPTLFEADSFPLIEAWHEDTPVACSNVTSLPGQSGDAALLFDPWTVDSIASALVRMTTDRLLRQRLRGNGRKRIGFFTWEKCAKTYRAIYRKLASYPLQGTDESLLEEALENPLF
jgi:glycosyltransferase involved in cell wall biosynthesis